MHPVWNQPTDFDCCREAAKRPLLYYEQQAGVVAGIASQQSLACNQMARTIVTRWAC